MHTLRESQVLDYQMQTELESVKAELETQRQEMEQLRLDLQDSINQLQRNQQERSITNRNNRAPAVKKRTSQMRLKRRESELDNQKKEMGQKTQICSMVSDLSNPLQAPESSQLPLLAEAH